MSEQSGEQILLLEAGPAVPDAASRVPGATLNRVFGDTLYQDATVPQPTVGGRAIPIEQREPRVLVVWGTRVTIARS